MKLHRVDILFNNPKLKKLVVSNLRVASHVGAVVLCDLIILVLWSSLQTPKAVDVMTTYASVQYPVADHVCSTGLHVPFEQAMLVEKCCLLFFAVWKVC